MGVRPIERSVEDDTVSDVYDGFLVFFLVIAALVFVAARRL